MTDFDEIISHIYQHNILIYDKGVNVVTIGKQCKHWFTSEDSILYNDEWKGLDKNIIQNYDHNKNVLIIFHCKNSTHLKLVDISGLKEHVDNS